ncbi:hypothetical protein [Thermopirellula anaerolimosa]
MNSYSAYCDDYYVNLAIDTMLSLPSNRETLLTFFERLQKAYPAMTNFFAREKVELALEEDRNERSYRWCSLEARRVTAGFLNPDSLAEAFEYHRLVAQTAPFHLSLSRLDCENVDLLFGFDFRYRGNHNQVVAEALGVLPALDSLRDLPGNQLIRYEPSIVLALDEDCRLQCRLEISTRTPEDQIRFKDYTTENLSVHFTVRHYGWLPGKDGFEQTLDLLIKTAQPAVEQYVIPNIVQPLVKAITYR